ncbi:MAG: hypothetical protein WAN43_01245 [Rhodomicrobium sp.]
MSKLEGFGVLALKFVVIFLISQSPALAALNDYYPQDNYRLLDTDIPVSSSRYLGEAARGGLENLTSSRASAVALAQNQTGEMVSVEEANKEGEPYGLHFSEPQTRALVDYLIDRKRKQLRSQEILSHAPRDFFSSTAIALAKLLVAAIDPVHIVPAIAIALSLSSWIWRMVAVAVLEVALSALSYGLSIQLQDDVGKQVFQEIAFGTPSTLLLIIITSMVARRWKSRRPKFADVPAFVSAGGEPRLEPQAESLKPVPDTPAPSSPASAVTDPRKWKPEHRAGLIALLIVGAAFGLIVGFFAHPLHRGTSGLVEWATYYPLEALAWPLLCALITGGTAYVWRQFRT